MPGLLGVDVAELWERWYAGGVGCSRLGSWVLVLMLRRTKSVVGDREIDVPVGVEVGSFVFPLCVMFQGV